ncbi:MAG: bifunctional hydroxymethylpyrimidine kinase/phosphomethylpyrimidine kinase [Deltaproteobacteria bacterium]|jgi:hydroxymethylpyrimidine/phosphomethylpyrimidine kinase|nr:bifunctional hydroxymethylpyrimidine kinase/phosphomethylpyrimidine kinase [Deltaproteobacteria bacterium]
MNEADYHQKTPKQYRKVLTIAGSDSGGGAGIQADLKTFSAVGCYGMSVITALTAQNTRGVIGIHPVPPAFAVEQIDAVLSDIGADAIKIGMLYSAELIEAVAAALKRHGARNLVLDPVMVAQSGDKLLQDDAVEAIKDYLMPLSEVVTPNLPEAVALAAQTLQNRQDVESAARALAAHGSRSILIKGGHGDDHQSSDLLYLAGEDRPVWLAAKRIQTRNNHGTGCTLSSAIAAYLAKGNDIEAAVQKAKDYMNRAIAAGAAYRIGHGHGPVHHFFKWWA